jgi:hypothetical protein
MAKHGQARTYTLRRASSVVFCMVSILPLFVYTLYALDALHQSVAQIGLASALVMSLIGFYIYSVMISRLSAILRELEEAEAHPQPPEAPTGTVVTAAVEPTPGMAAPGVPRNTPPPRRPSPFAAGSSKGTGGRASLVVPGMGRITELKPNDAGGLGDLDSMWKAEAQPLLGKRVLVAVRNAPEPIKGTLAQVTNDGVMIDQDDGSKVGISYNRMSAIEANSAPEPA